MSSATPPEAAVPPEIENDGPDGPSPTDRSLKARMERRRRELAERKTRKFPVPRWDEILVVELRVLGDKELEIIEGKSARGGAAPRMLYVEADQLVAATVGFWAYNDAEELEPVDDATWGTIARAYAGFELPEQAGQRSAFLALVGASNVSMLFGQWRLWVAGAETGLDEEVRSDFGRTA